MKDETLAFLGWSDGRVLMARGPFETASAPPRTGAAFYVNDFALSAPRPWLVPADWSLMDRASAASALGKAPGFRVEWSPLVATAFAEVFQQISVAIRQGVFEKTVPVVGERGTLEGPTAAGFFQRALVSADPVVPYGFGTGGRGFAGMSPEYLLSIEGRRLKTMALAGTARVEEREVLAVDEKEIREHEFVAQALVSKLGDLGKLSRGEREILDLGPIVHFHTPIQVELGAEPDIDALIHRLHPTPALGPLPRTEETMSRLLEWRDRLGTPPEFGAPFGAVVDGGFRAIVAIRGLWWDGPEVRLPAGCGVIEASRLVNEWRELRLKREAVKARFGV